MKRVPIQTPWAPKASAAASPRPCERACGEHRDPDGVDDLRDQGHAGDLPGVAAGLGPLGDHGVAARALGVDRMAHLAAHAHHLDAAAVALLDHALRNPEACDEAGGPLRDDHVKAR
jgi:hypothetical protein